MFDRDLAEDEADPITNCDRIERFGLGSRLPHDDGNPRLAGGVADFDLH
jgi:hypothetical protein